jgi:hypothetical protein
MAQITDADVRAWLGEMATAGYLNVEADSRALAAHALAMLGRPPALDDDQLTAHFTLTEFTYSATAQAEGIDNTPDDAERAEIQRTAELMERVRTLLDDQAVIISSGFRCAQLNAAIGGASNSAHLYGCAADFTAPDYGSPLDICLALEPYLAELAVDQLIHENAAWVHIGRAIPPSTTARCECLTIDSQGTRYGFT